MGNATVQEKNGAFYSLIPIELARENVIEASDELPLRHHPASDILLVDLS